MLGVEPGEFGQIVQALVPVIRHQFFQVGFHGHNVHQVAVFIQGAAFQLHLNLVMVGMELIFGAPIGAERKCRATKSRFTARVYRCIVSSSGENSGLMREQCRGGALTAPALHRPTHHTSKLPGQRLPGGYRATRKAWAAWAMGKRCVIKRAGCTCASICQVA